MKASALFKKRPEKWGLRGDPYFWDYLETIFEKYECPMKPEDIETTTFDNKKYKTNRNFHSISPFLKYS